MTTVGGNSPQWLVNRAASDIAAGTTVGDGHRRRRGHPFVPRSAGRRACPATSGTPALPPDPVVGDDLPGVGPAETAIGLMAPVHVYPLFESVVAARAGHDAREHRRRMGKLFAPFTEVAAANPYAWFPSALHRRGDRHPDSRTTASSASPTPSG